LEISRLESKVMDKQHVSESFESYESLKIECRRLEHCLAIQGDQITEFLELLLNQNEETATALTELGQPINICSQIEN